MILVTSYIALVEPLLRRSFEMYIFNWQKQHRLPEQILYDLSCIIRVFFTPV
jgi:hypothetical protein